MLLDHARADGGWAAWNDAGLAAAAAGDTGPAVAALLKAHLLAPHQPDPRQALHSLGQKAPNSWSAALGPLIWCAVGIGGGTLALIAGLGFGWAACGTRHRQASLLTATVCLLLLAPGLLAQWHDHQRQAVATITDTWLLDASGTPLRRLSPGTILSLRSSTPWEGRWLVITSGGLAGGVPITACGDP